LVTLFVLQGPDKGRQFDVATDEPAPLGRMSESIPLTDPTVSRLHATLHAADGGWVLKDEGSANGVFVNGVRVDKAQRVKTGDQIRMGNTLLVFGSAQRSVSVSHPGRGANHSDESAIISTVPSNDDSVILAAPEPSQAAMKHFRTLLQITTAIASIFDRDELLNKVMDLVFDQVRADRGFIALLNPRTKAIEPVVVRFKDQENQIAISNTIIQHVLQKNEGVLSSNAMTDQRFSKGKSVHSLSIRSAICVPIKGREQLLGVISIDSVVANYAYTADQLRLMTAIGLQTGLALDSARLFQENVKRERLAATGQTVASLSHSIKNILQGISGGADVVEIGLRRSDIPEITKGWGILQRNLDKVQQLTMNMLTFAKEREPNLELNHLPHVLNECLELVRPMAEDRGIVLVEEVNESQPPVPVDADGIHQAVLNLLMNAVDAVGPKTGVVTLRSDFDAATNEAVIEVQDNGHGIAEEDVERIFQAFYSTKGQKGTGLGLAVARKIVEEHQGTIEVASQVNAGTTFTLRLPAAQETVDVDSSQTHGTH
jgi:two-component system NtrC family sensor kinase